MKILLNDRRVLLPVVLTAIAIAIGSMLIIVLSDDAAGAGAAQTPAATVSGAVTVDITDFKYGPEALAVAAGTKVTWRNNDAAPHTATVKDGFDTGTLRKGERKTLTLETAGTFAYICTIHPFMTASVIVR